MDRSHALTEQHAVALQRMRFQCMEGSSTSPELTANIAALDYALTLLREPPSDEIERLRASHAELIKAEQWYRANEQMALRRLSDALSGGNAGTWDEVFHAAESLALREPPATPSGRTLVLREAQAAIREHCGMCDGHGFTVETGTVSGHGCDGTEASCLQNCPVPIPVQVQEECEYCGRPIAAIEKLITPSLGETPAPLEETKEDHGAGLIGQTIPDVAGTEPRLSIPVTAEELDWVEHAAKLRSLAAVEYVRRAINLSLRQEGVDAVLLAESDDDAGVPRCAMCEHVFDDDEVIRVVEMKLVCEDCYHDLPEAE